MNTTTKRYVVPRATLPVMAALLRHPEVAHDVQLDCNGDGTVKVMFRAAATSATALTEHVRDLIKRERSGRLQFPRGMRFI